MEAYAKRYRIPKAKKYAKDVLRLFKDAKSKSGQWKRRWQHGENRHQSMPIEQECKICKRVFTLSKEQEELYESNRAANQPLALGCPLCGRTWMMTFAKPEEEKAHPLPLPGFALCRLGGLYHGPEGKALLGVRCVRLALA